MKENTVEEAIAKAFKRQPDAIRRANMMLGDVGETAVSLDTVTSIGYRSGCFVR